MSRRWLLSPNSLCSWTRRTFLLLLLCIVALIITKSSDAQGTIKVDESKTKIFLAREPAEVQLAIESSLQQSSKVRIHLTDASRYALLTFPIPPRYPQSPHVLRPAGGRN